MLGCSCRVFFAHSLYICIYVQAWGKQKKNEREFFFTTPSAHHLANKFVYIILSIIYDLSFFFTSTFPYTSSLRIISHLIDTVAMRCRDEYERERKSNNIDDVVWSDFIACRCHDWNALLRYRHIRLSLLLSFRTKRW